MENIFLSLPVEVWLCITNYLDNYSLCCLSRVQPFTQIIRPFDIAHPEEILKRALLQNHLEIIKFVVGTCCFPTFVLIEALAGVPESGPELQIIKTLLDLEPYTPPLSALLAAIKHGKEEVVDFLCQRGKKFPLVLPDDIYTLPMTKNIRNLLINYDPEGVFPQLVESGSLEEVKGLLAQGLAIPNTKVLEGAARSNQTKMVRALLDHCSPTQRAYVLAIKNGNLDMAELLNGDPNAMEGKERPLHYAVRASSGAGVEYLLAKGANQNLPNMAGLTPFDVALESNNSAAILALNGGRHRYALRRRAPTTIHHEAGKRRRRV